MIYIPRNIAAFASTHETSNEIALAIFLIAEEGDEERMWQEPTAVELESVMRRAWEIADKDTDALHWGVETHRR